MNPSDVHEIGEVIRKVRKEKGLRLEDLADKNISPSTISNIERGIPHVNTEKIRYLLHKLDIRLDELPTLMMTERQELKDLKFRLFMIECLCDTEKGREALKRLAQLDLDESHPFVTVYNFLYGKTFSRLKDWQQTEYYLNNALRMAKQLPNGRKSNIIAATYNELGIHSYWNNDINQALEFAKRGIDSFYEGGERPQYHYLLRRNQAIYLERLGRTGEAMKLVLEYWPQINKIEQVDSLVSFYWLRAELSYSSGLMDEAIKVSKKGLEIARMNHHYRAIFDLWSILGKVYMNKKDWFTAEACFQTALQVHERYPHFNSSIKVFTFIALLYMHQKEWEKACQYLLKGIELGEKYNDAPRLSFALLIMGDYYRYQNNQSKANHYYKRALHLARKHRLQKREYAAMMRLPDSDEILNRIDMIDFLGNISLIFNQTNLMR